jgi:hypothetical protein
MKRVNIPASGCEAGALKKMGGPVGFKIVSLSSTTRALRATPLGCGEESVLIAGRKKTIRHRPIRGTQTLRDNQSGFE